MTRGEFFSGPVKNQKCEKMPAERGVCVRRLGQRDHEVCGQIRGLRTRDLGFVGSGETGLGRL
jgi:hypothetical protein